MEEASCAASTPHQTTRGNKNFFQDSSKYNIEYCLSDLKSFAWKNGFVVSCWPELNSRPFGWIHKCWIAQKIKLLVQKGVTKTAGNTRRIFLEVGAASMNFIIYDLGVRRLRPEENSANLETPRSKFAKIFLFFTIQRGLSYLYQSQTKRVPWDACKSIYTLKRQW